MMLGLLGKKIGMMRLYDSIGEYIVVTVIKTGPCQVVQKKTVENDGYNALQLGFGTKKEKHTSKALKGHFLKSKIDFKSALKEFRIKPEDVNNYEVGQELKVKDFFNVGQFTDIVGTSKGKGFEGTIKRHNFNRGPMTHGSRNHRLPGSVGACGPSKVFKGKKMPGRMGSDRVTVQNVEIIKIDEKENLLFVKGAVPGNKGSILSIKKALKKNAVLKGASK
ncbi:50S ribosomal protein L3 [bacterium]|nr:50S ribosomal protein L3 [bacterium]